MIVYALDSKSNWPVMDSKLLKILPLPSCQQGMMDVTLTMSSHCSEYPFSCQFTLKSHVREDWLSELGGLWLCSEVCYVFSSSSRNAISTICVCCQCNHMPLILEPHYWRHCLTFLYFDRSNHQLFQLLDLVCLNGRSLIKMF